MFIIANLQVQEHIDPVTTYDDDALIIKYVSFHLIYL